MAYRDLRDDDEQRATANSAPLAGAATVSPASGAATASAAPTPAQASGSRFVPFSQYLAANRTAADATADRIAGDVERQAQGAQASTAMLGRQAGNAGTLGRIRGDVPTQPSPAESDAFPGVAGAVHDAQTAVNNTGTTGGLQQLIGTGSGGAGRFDAALVGAAGADRFGQLRSRYADLQGALSNAATSTEGASPAAGAPPGMSSTLPRSSVDEEEQRRRRQQQVAGRRQRLGTERIGGY